MIAKMKSNIYNQKLFAGVIVFAAIFVITVVLVVGIKVFGGNTLTPNVTQVVLNGKTYTKEDPFVILEIVPQKGIGELGYMVGGDSMPILASDIANISDQNKKSAILDAWKDCTAFITQLWDRNKYSDDGTTIEGFEDRNLFANSVFGNSDMSDKLMVKTMSAADVRTGDVAAADMVYINPGYHSDQDLFCKAYNLMAEVNNKYKSVNTYLYKAEFNNNSNINNFSAEVALEIYLKSIKNGMPVVYDDSSMKPDGPDENDNYSKLGMLLLSIEPDTFITEYASENINGIYSGTKGSIGVYNSILQIKRNSSSVEWSSYIFVENNNPQYPYFNGTDKGRNQIYLRNNVLAYAGYNLMDMVFLNDGDNRLDYDSNGNYLGTDFNNARKFFEIEDGDILPYTKMARYIIGDFPSNETFEKINVLEIEPCGYDTNSTAYTYNNYAGSVKIASYLGYNTKLIPENDWTSYVNVKCVASNGFNGMNEDLAEKYDLIIVGSNDFGGKLISPSTYIYSSKGTEVKIVNLLNAKTRYSGNDLTQKSLTKIVNFAKAGKPIVLSKDLYYGSSKIDSSLNSKIYNLSIVKLRSELAKDSVSDKNIMDMPDTGDSFRYLQRLVKPVIAISDNLKVKYRGDDLATTTVQATSLSNLEFYGKIGKNANTYNLVVTVDKNGNGIFAPESNNDTNEVFYNASVTTASDGSFSINLNLPDGLRGYVAWKAVVTDTKTGSSSEDLGGFVIEVRSEDVKIVNLLQILPVVTDSNRPITLNMKTNSKFKELFEQAEVSSGIKLNVTTMTTREFEDMYKGGNDYLNYETDNLLKNYSMIVFGFADSYSVDDISNEHGALDNVKDFINMGNSALFTHDTMSYSAYSDGTTDSNGNTIFEKGKDINPGKTGGFELTSKFRDVIGMDRYGASLGNSSGSDYVQGLSNQFLIKYGRTDANESYSIFSNIKPSTSDIQTNEVKQLNQGQLTEFPYYISNKLTISPTHPQWFQLDLERQTDNVDDVVVWYTLGSSSTSGFENSIFNDYTGQDALNSYYIYSKGNITYSGAGHKAVSEKGELKLFVNTVIRAILSGNSTPEIKVTNAAPAAHGVYDLYTKDNSKLPTIDFKAIDADLSRNTGEFTSGMVYWDVDKNASYSYSDVILVEYNSNNVLKNAFPVSIDLQSYTNKSYGEALQKCFYERELKIGIQATDSMNSTGSANVSVIYRNLFYLN